LNAYTCEKDPIEIEKSGILGHLMFFNDAGSKVFA